MPNKSFRSLYSNSLHKSRKDFLDIKYPARLPEDLSVEGLGDHDEVGEDEGQIRQAEAGQQVVECFPH